MAVGVPSGRSPINAAERRQHIARRLQPRGLRVTSLGPVPHLQRRAGQQQLVLCVQRAQLPDQLAVHVLEAVALRVGWAHARGGTRVSSRLLDRMCNPGRMHVHGHRPAAPDATTCGALRLVHHCGFRSVNVLPNAEKPAPMDPTNYRSPVTRAAQGRAHTAPHLAHHNARTQPIDHSVSTIHSSFIISSSPRPPQCTASPYAPKPTDQGCSPRPPPTKPTSTTYKTNPISHLVHHNVLPVVLGHELDVGQQDLVRGDHHREGGVHAA